MASEVKLSWSTYGSYSGWAHWGTMRANKLEVPGEPWLTKSVRVAARAELVGHLGQVD